MSFLSDIESVNNNDIYLSCSNLRQFIIKDCLVSENGLRNAISKFKLTKLDLTLYKYSVYTILFDFINELPKDFTDNIT